MARLVFGMNVSLDGYVDHEAFAPGVELFEHFIEQTRSLSGIIYGRGLYDVMRYWDSDAWEQHDQARAAQLHDYAQAWRCQPKWVMSRSLKLLGPNATLVGDDVAEAVDKLKKELDGRIDVGGPKLAASLTERGLIDEYHLYLHPIVLGAGNRFFAGAAPPLELVANERIGESVVRLTYVPA